MATGRQQKQQQPANKRKRALEQLLLDASSNISTDCLAIPAFDPQSVAETFIFH